MLDLHSVRDEELTSEDLDLMAKLLVQNWTRMNPDRECVILSVPLNDPQECKKILEFYLKIHSGDAYEEYCRQCRIG